MTGNLHPNSDYISRKKGGRGLKEIKTIDNRLIAIRQHLLINNSRKNMRYAIQCEQPSIIRVGN